MTAHNICSYQSTSFLLRESLSACAKPATPCSKFENIFRASVLSSNPTLVVFVIPGRRHKIERGDMRAKRLTCNPLIDEIAE